MIRLIQLETCESTNDEAWKHLPETTLVVTKRQTRGRGRQGRSWSDDEGNIMASLAITPPENLGDGLMWVPIAAGVSAAEAIELLSLKAAPSAALDGLRLKWPNDLMWEGSKMGGILCESRFSGDKISGIVIGIGLNLKTAPQLSDMATAALFEKVDALTQSKDDVRGRLLGVWADRVEYWLAELEAKRVEQLRKTWLRFAKLEKFPEFRVHDRNGNTLKLRALDLDSSGRLKAEGTGSKIVYLDQPG